MAHFYTNNTLAIQYCVIVIFDKLDHFNVSNKLDHFLAKKLGHFSFLTCIHIRRITRLNTR